ncbi:MAG TPA: hypothetical protein DEA22_00460 [Blastocatellia bacterium]|nr:hypothetical protein [Blastocatellia bacterium]
MKLLFLFLITVFTALAAAGQSASAILKKAERALGGKQAMEKAAARTQTGSITKLSGNAVGRYSLTTARPNLLKVSWDIEGFEFESGYNGRSAWVRDSREGLRTLTGHESMRFQAEAAFRNSLWLNYKKEKSRIVKGGKADAGGRVADTLILTNSKGTSIKIFFDGETGLPIREEFPGTEGVTAYDYSDFRSVGAGKMPFAVTMHLGDEIYKIEIDSIDINQKPLRSDFDFPKFNDDPLPEIRSLLADLQENEDHVEEILDTYSYLQKIIRRKLGKDGILRETGSETYQMSFYKGYRITRLIEKNGSPLSASDQEDADREAQKEAEKIEKKIAKAEKENARSHDSDDRGRRISIAEVLRASNLLNPRRERFRGRDVIVFDFEPNPKYDFKNAKSLLKFFGKTAGVIWIDEKDKQVARIEAFLASNYNIGGGILAKLKKGAAFTLEQERVNNEIWLPSSADINLSVRVLLLKGVDVNQVIKSYDYRKFETEVKGAKIDEVSQP